MTTPVEEWLGETCAASPHTLDDYESEMPRWCKGCGDHGVLTSLQRLLRNRNVDPEAVVVVSGIGCSSRLPHYIRAYGFHGIHGRALPIAMGVSLARPDLNVVVTMGDGDCFSIGGNHWLHALRYNFNALVLVLDNEIYALTKAQASPTTPVGCATHTTPQGSRLSAMNPLRAIMGMTNVSFLAQTATWFPDHLDATLDKAWDHTGLSFVRILQRCPVYMPGAFGEGGRKFPVVFLQNSDGIAADAASLRRGTAQAHDQTNLHQAQRVADTENPAPMGLIFRDARIPTYEQTRRDGLRKPDRKAFVERLSALLDGYAVK